MRSWWSCRGALSLQVGVRVCMRAGVCWRVDWLVQCLSFPLLSFVLCAAYQPSTQLARLPLNPHPTQTPGVNLEVVMQPPARTARIESAEQLSMRQLLEAYAKATGMSEAVFGAAEGVLKVRVGAC